VFKNTGVVLAMILIIGLFIFGLDTVFMNLLGLFMNIAK
jgi:preprotein translocase subunit SecE